MAEHTFELEQDGIVVATVTAANREDAMREIMHYALVYSQDGPVSIKGVEQSDWDALANPSSPPQG